MINRPSLYGKDTGMSSVIQKAVDAMTPKPYQPSAAPSTLPSPLPSQAPAPAAITPPVSPPGRSAMATPTAQPYAAASPVPAATPPASSPNGGVGQVISAVKAGAHKDKYGQMWDQIYEGVDPQDKADLDDYIHFVQSLPTYKGSRDAQMAAIMNYSRQLKQNRRGSTALDDHALASMGDNYNALDDQLGASLAAMGVSGPALAGAHSNLRGKENASIGEYLAQATEQRRKEALALRMQQLGYDQQMINMAMQRYSQEHQGGGLLGDILGTVGTIGGALIGGPIGAGVGAAAGSFAGGHSGPSPGYGNASYGGYGPPDPNQYYGPWEP